MSGAGVSHSRGGPTWEALRDAVAMVFVRSQGYLDSPSAPHEWSVIMDSQGVFFLDLPPPSQHQAQAWTRP